MTPANSTGASSKLNPTKPANFDNFQNRKAKRNSKKKRRRTRPQRRRQIRLEYRVICSNKEGEKNGESLTEGQMIVVSPQAPTTENPTVNLRLIETPTPTSPLNGQYPDKDQAPANDPTAKTGPMANKDPITPTAHSSTETEHTAPRIQVNI